jgi:hypothetical protein
MPILYTEEVRSLDALLDDMDNAVKTSLFLDERWQVPDERMEELRSRAKLLRLEDRGGRLGSEGVGEGLPEVDELRSFLRQAMERGLNLLLD